MYIAFCCIFQYWACHSRQIFNYYKNTADFLGLVRHTSNNREYKKVAVDGLGMGCYAWLLCMGCHNHNLTAIFGIGLTDFRLPRLLLEWDMDCLLSGGFHNLFINWYNTKWMCRCNEESIIDNIMVSWLFITSEDKNSCQFCFLILMRRMSEITLFAHLYETDNLWLT